MPYKELVKDPLIVAAISSLIGLSFAHFYGVWKQKLRRSSGFSILRHQLENQERQLRELRVSLTGKNICIGLESTVIINFINSEIIDLAIDEALIKALYEHLDNIEILRRALDLILMRAAGWTTAQDEEKAALENNVKAAISGCLEELQNCLDKLQIQL